MLQITCLNKLNIAHKNKSKPKPDKSWQWRQWCDRRCGSVGRETAPFGPLTMAPVSDRPAGFSWIRNYFWNVLKINRFDDCMLKQLYDHNYKHINQMHFVRFILKANFHFFFFYLKNSCDIPFLKIRIIHFGIISMQCQHKT